MHNAYLGQNGLDVLFLQLLLLVGLASTSSSALGSFLCVCPEGVGGWVDERWEVDRQSMKCTLAPLASCFFRFSSFFPAAPPAALAWAFLRLSRLPIIVVPCGWGG